ncbi:PDZ domain-containing protein [Psychroserpens sp.]|uniref:S41 family peptidase n=1 Tax=Psychroserpens sp. TaxID=2020870 RepID=UPI001B092D0B|nr:PDZ domain-containing protein [Psychroserpens sp.]MBO6607423.1 PDZ domain-containing protein [Psychroserpens sp.]MBO6654499.1 PDZ domain-containing protein [Psychroserpens sp.]MBO6681152.1 PDZ domain-containing protein [Psychroserpens sp.]MBO6749891.1 PDZ domain-containing protein [Psychroserpens sp.]MBO6916121.1 PDZ domain-containing protein [Psychroserpens sp.]
MNRFLLGLIGLFCISTTAQNTKLLRQPTLHNNDVVFVYANDLWKASVNGGTAIRLTSDDGYESNPHFSNDGQWIAFTAQYDGNIDVFVIPTSGGEPKRLTYHPSGDFVQGWTPDGKILFRSGREGRPTQTNKFFTVSTNGGLPETLDIPRAAYGEISSDGKHVAYTPITSWDPEWRNYRGGQAMPIWIVDLKTKALVRTPQSDGERHLDPVWLNGIVYYLSERDYTSNIWSFDPKTETETQMTFHKKFDVKSLDASANMIVYEQGGSLHTLNPSDKSSKTLNIEVKADLNFSRARWENVSGRQLTNPNISPNGKRAVFEHRGEIFTVPKENGTWRNLTNSSGVADRTPIWSPKGDKIAWFSDKSGEYQLVLADQDGQNQEYVKLPNNTFYFQPDWSPDGKHIAYTDTDYNIWIINLESKKAVKAATDRYAHPNRAMNPVWSPDSKWIAFAKQNESHFKSIYAYNVDSKNTVQLTDPIADAISPVWDASGKYVYTLASTNYGLATGWLDMSSYDPETTRSLYTIVLNSTDKAPNHLKTDEEAVKKEDDKTEDKAEDKKENGVTVTIDTNGLWDRAVAMNLSNGNYIALGKAPKGHIFVVEAGDSGLKVHDYDVEKDEASDFAEGIGNMVISEDRKSTLISKNGSWAIVGTSGKANFNKGKLNTNLKLKVNPQEEYHQIFKEGWRYMRDFLYVDNVHGAPWDDVYKWYSPWIDHVRHRTDLNYVVDIMSGEVAVGHSYVSGGDFPDVDRVPVGLLGADIKTANGKYQITKIYSGERWNPGTSGPLAQPGMNVKEGDYIVAINGVEITKNENPYQLLEQTAGREITISVNNKPSMDGAESVLVKPVSSERSLRYVDWVESNRRKVDELSNGKLAYIYVPNTGGGGFTSFNRYYFSQQEKKGAIIDERNNGGGSAADYMIDIMNRKLFGYFNSKTNDNRPWTTPMAGIWGPKVMIINERAGSGGDLLPYMFKMADIGPLVGTRTWGGLVGTWDTPRFIDGGRMVAPRGGFYDVDGNWAVEGEGVAPDIEVIQDPKSVLNGNDPQLERAVEEAMRLLKNNEFELQPEPAPPIRSKRPKGYKNDN